MASTKSSNINNKNQQNLIFYAAIMCFKSDMFDNNVGWRKFIPQPWNQTASVDDFSKDGFGFQFKDLERYYYLAAR